MKFRPPLQRKLSDPDADAVRESTSNAVIQLQGLDSASLRALGAVSLPSGVVVWVPHRLGRVPKMVQVSPPRAAIGTTLTAGIVQELRGSTGGTPIDSTQSIVLVASGYGATVTVDLAVL